MPCPHRHNPRSDAIEKNGNTFFALAIHACFTRAGRQRAYTSGSCYVVSTQPSHKIPYLANKLPAINPSVPGQDSTQAHFTLQAHPATAHEETKPRAQVAQVAVSDKAIAVSCPECAKSGRAYSRLFYGPHVDPLTGKQLPLDYLHLPVSDSAHVPAISWTCIAGMA